jgi:type I restriction enzyme R subunit
MIGEPRSACSSGTSILSARKVLRASSSRLSSARRAASDLAELERMLAESGVGELSDIARAKETSEGLGLFVRSLVGMDREAAKGALGEFLAGKTLSANQIEFVNLIVDQLTDQGIMSASALYESPSTDVAPEGPEAIFTPEDVDRLFDVLDTVRATAIGGG